MNRLYHYQSLVYKIILLCFCTALTVYVFPNNNRFKYDFNQGEPWDYETLYAPFSFPIEKGEQTLLLEQQAVSAKTPRYFKVDKDIKDKVYKNWFTKYKSITDSLSNQEFKLIVNDVQSILNTLYKVGYLEVPLDLDNNQSIVLTADDEVASSIYDNIYLPNELSDLISKKNILTDNPKVNKTVLISSLLSSLEPNVFYDKELTDLAIKEELSKILTTRGLVSQGARIIAQGEIVEGQKLLILNTLNNTYKSQTWTDSQYNWKLTGYIILVGMAYAMLLLFLWRYRKEIFSNFRKLFFIFFNIGLIIVLTATVVNINVEYIYIVPVCILPLVLKAFFDARLGLFTHVVTIFILSFIVPNSDEYLFFQMMSGIVTILSGNEIYKRANLFLTVAQIIGVYFISYFAFYAINQGGVVGWEWGRLGYFVLCGLAMLFVWPLIYIFEKIFGLVSDVSLLELSDTNSKLLKELSNKAPGTFYHSLNVANIAETIANEIGANAMLVRVGALYHDIGKMKNPTYFTENQGSGINPHHDIDPEDSARIIIDHTINGIEIARKYNLPDRIIDFIRTHHGDSLVYYFYTKAKEDNPDVDKDNFRYPGPRPFSLETAILMISDSVEAASKSLKNPTSIKIDQLVDKIIEGQVDSGQFLNANITFKQIELIKVLIKKKLASIYHVRIEYPE
ncbi:HDIG domain-containing metalloprotein [uncultured Nonlabens sp.]|uniref:HD family phosphohydrolase n=1 Tax=uncultured Nonlabens sp. TaxID=859306 RepID=UPI00260BBAB8|nr:HDIG domain-containing metalloprotein [uncultured Nonlabens sp.]